MPANLTPDYKRAEQAYRAAQDERERLAHLKEMLRTIPKHKGTEHLQADIKSRIRQLSDELAGPKKGAARVGPVHVVRREGAAQIALLGPPASGKSSLHSQLTGSRAAGEHPHPTYEPLPGMLPYEDIHFQLVDLPPISAEHVESWLPNALQPADAALVVIDIADPACTDQLEALLRQLADRRIHLVARWPADEPEPQETGDEDAPLDDPFAVRLPALLLANKCDLELDPGDLDALKELTGAAFPSLATSAVTRAGLDEIGPFLFRRLGILRVYTKAPGKPAERDRPFTLPRGATVHDVARLVHKDIAGSLRYARAWGLGVFDGQQVGPEHALSDGDVVELHMR